MVGLALRVPGMLVMVLGGRVVGEDDNGELWVLGGMVEVES